MAITYFHTLTQKTLCMHTPHKTVKSLQFPPLGSGWLDICVDYFVRRDALINELEEIDIEEDLLLKVELDPQECC